MKDGLTAAPLISGVLVSHWIEVDVLGGFIITAATDDNGDIIRDKNGNISKETLHGNVGVLFGK